jgi:hypothetical protein
MKIIWLHCFSISMDDNRMRWTWGKSVSADRIEVLFGEMDRFSVEDASMVE